VTLSPLAAGRMAEGLGDHGLAHLDGVVEDDRFLRLDEAQGGRNRGSARRDLGL